MWRHLVAAAAAIAVTLVILNFWGNFGGVMTHFVKLRGADAAASAPMPIAVVTAPNQPCAKNAPCPHLPDGNPDSTP